MAKAAEQKSQYSKLARKLKGSDYGDAINSLQTDLKLLEASGAEMEALLIYIVNRRYRQQSYNADIALMALGLLDGYNNRTDRLEPSEERDLYAERREKFLEKTSYIAMKYGNQAKTYKEAKQTLVKNRKSGEMFPLIERIRNSLNSSTTNCLISVLTMLYEENGDGHLEKAKEVFQKRACEKKIKSIDWSKDHISLQLLPSLKCYGRPPEEASLSQPCDTVKNLNFIDKKDSTEAARVIALAPTGPVEPDSEPPTEQIQEPTPESPLEPSTSVHDLTLKLISESTLESSTELTQEPEPFSEPTPVSTTEPTSDSAEELTQGVPPEPTQESSENITPESIPESVLGITPKMCADTTSELPSDSTSDSPLDITTKPIPTPLIESYICSPNDEMLPQPETSIKPPNPNIKKGKLDLSSKPNKWIAIATVVILLFAAFAVLLFVMHTKDKDRNVAIDPVKAVEGGGIIDSNETSVETNVSVTFQSSSGAIVNVNASGIDNFASVSVIMTDKDGKTEQVDILNGVYDRVTTEQQEVADKDSSEGVDTYEDEN